MGWGGGNRLFCGGKPNYGKSTGFSLPLCLVCSGDAIYSPVLREMH